MAGFGDMLKWIDGQDARLRQLLCKWAAINTYSENVAGLSAFADRLAAEFAGLGGAVERVAMKPREVINDQGEAVLKAVGDALICRSKPRGGWARRVFLAIHMDTVYPHDGKITLEGDVMLGPGVADAKGGLLVMLFALKALEQSEYAGGVAWEVLLNADEEVGSPSSGGLFLEAAARNEIGLLFEPALPGGVLASSRKGSGNWTAVVRGRAAHAGRDFAHGRNAIAAAADLISGLEKIAIPGATVNVGSVRGGGPVNVVPDLALCRWNVRVESAEQAVMIEEKVGGVLEHVRKRDGITLEIHGGFHAPPKLLDRSTERLLEALQDCGKEINVPIEWKPTGGTCDGNRLAAAGLPTVDNLGVRGGEIHSEREFCDLKSLTERAKLTALLLMKLGSGELKSVGKAAEISAQEIKS